MTANEYQQAALRTINTNFWTRHDRLTNGALGLCGESGEVADIVKKALFQGHDLDEKHIAEELGDCAWYLAITADAIGMTLNDIFVMNIDKLFSRYPDGFSADKSVHRKEYEEC